MARRAVVFIGPSLPVGYVAGPSVELRPPAVRGQLLEAALAGTSVIGLVDGEFYQSSAVTPAEVRQAAATGVTLLGAASMGALRASEQPQRMRGIGEIYRRFAVGELTADDEVAALYEPTTYRVLAYPLVTLRDALRVACEEQALSLQQAEQVLARVRLRPFHDRSLQLILLEATTCAAPHAASVLHGLLATPDVDIKRRDAALLLKEVEQHLL